MCTAHYTYTAYAECSTNDECDLQCSVLRSTPPTFLPKVKPARYPKGIPPVFLIRKRFVNRYRPVTFVRISHQRHGLRTLRYLVRMGRIRCLAQASRISQSSANERAARAFKYPMQLVRCAAILRLFRTKACQSSQHTASGYQGFHARSARCRSSRAYSKREHAQQPFRR